MIPIAPCILSLTYCLNRATEIKLCNDILLRYCLFIILYMMILSMDYIPNEFETV